MTTQYDYSKADVAFEKEFGPKGIFPGLATLIKWGDHRAIYRAGYRAAEEAAQQSVWDVGELVKRLRGLATETCLCESVVKEAADAIEKLLAASAQPVGEPVAWMSVIDGRVSMSTLQPVKNFTDGGRLLYAAPTPCPNIVHDKDGTSYCKLAEA